MEIVDKYLIGHISVTTAVALTCEAHNVEFQEGLKILQREVKDRMAKVNAEIDKYK